MSIEFIGGVVAGAAAVTVLAFAQLAWTFRKARKVTDAVERVPTVD